MSRIWIGLAILTFVLAPSVGAQDDSPRALFQAGKFEQAVEAGAQLGDAAAPSDIYAVAQSLTRLDRRDEAREMFRRLDKGDEETAWNFISRSAVAVIEGNRDAALDLANQAVSLEPENFHAQYQLGLVNSLREDFAGAANALERATEIDPGHAYAHYYAGIAFSKIRRVDQMARHFRAFVTLAPDAPERGQVDTLLRTLR
jgi:tetratricopeptide (TPR) repeat protein